MGQQTLLRLLEHHGAAIRACLRQHGALHTAALAAAGTWSFQDEVLSGLGEEEGRRPAGNGHAA